MIILKNSREYKLTRYNFLHMAFYLSQHQQRPRYFARSRLAFFGSCLFLVGLVQPFRNSLLTAHSALSKAADTRFAGSYFGRLYPENGTHLGNHSSQLVNAVYFLIIEVLLLPLRTWVLAGGLLNAK